MSKLKPVSVVAIAKAKGASLLSKPKTLLKRLPRGKEEINKNLSTA